MRTSHAAAVAAVLIAISSPAALAQPSSQAASSAAIRAQAERLPIGSTVKLRLIGGEPLTAVLVAVGADDLVVKPKTRAPQQSRRIPLDRIDALRGQEDRVSFGKYASVGAAIGGAVFLLLLALVE